jgi:hypothetical protein
VIISNEFIYTEGGIVENIAPPACRFVSAHNGRLWALGLENNIGFWYSKEVVSGEGIAFSDLFQKQIAPEGGALTAGASLDDKMVFFKGKNLYMMAGRGPTDTGAQDDFTTPQLIPTTVGCTNGDSIATLPQGVVFQSANGLWLLTRGLTTEYIGKNVHDYNNLTITSAVVLAENNQLRFTTTDQCLVYEFILGQWTTFTNYAALSAVNWRGTFVLLRDNGRIYLESQDKYTDDGQSFSMKVKTAWFRGQLQGRMRLWNLTLLGELISSHILRIRKYQDYDENKFEQKLFKTDDQLDVSSWGTSTDLWGGTSVLGSEKNGVYQFELSPDHQRCESMRFEFEDIPNPGGTGSSGGPAYSLSGLTLRIGVSGTTVKSSKAAS